MNDQLRDKYIIYQSYEEPTPDRHSYEVELTKSELARLIDAINFINSHPDSGDTVSQFKIMQTENYSILLSFEEAFEMLLLESRYEEDIFDNTYPPFENTD